MSLARWLQESRRSVMQVALAGVAAAALLTAQVPASDARVRCCPTSLQYTRPLLSLRPRPHRQCCIRGWLARTYKGSVMRMSLFVFAFGCRHVQILSAFGTCPAGTRGREEGRVRVQPHQQAVPEELLHPQPRQEVDCRLPTCLVTVSENHEKRPATTLFATHVSQGSSVTVTPSTAAAVFCSLSDRLACS